MCTRRAEANAPSELSDALSIRLVPPISSQEPDICERFATAGLRLVLRASGTANEKSGNSGRTRGSADMIAIG